LADLAELIAKILKREAVAGKRPRCDILRFLFINRLLGTLDKRKNVSHAENARNDPVRMKWLKRIIFFTHANELDRRTRDLTDREHRATARVPGHLGQHDSRERRECVKFLAQRD